MPGFIHKKLSSSKALPEILKEARWQSNLSLEEVSFKTQISIRYLEALEEGAYDKLPGEVYNRQFIKKLAKQYLLSETTLLKIYQQEKESQLSFKTLLSPEAPPAKHFFYWLSPKIIRNSFITILIIGCLTYLGFEVKNIFSPPLLEINSPATQTITHETNIKITGQTEPEAVLLINNQEILPEPNGDFSETVDLTMGLNTFEISAKKKHSKANGITLSILRQPTVGSEVNPAPPVSKTTGINVY